MIQLMRRICQDRRGNALALAGAALPLVFGCAGLASDTIQWALWKRQLQRAADSAAMAGVYALVDGKDDEAAVDSDLETNNHTGITLLDKDVTNPTVSPYTNAVRVRLEIQKKLGFSSLFLSDAPVIAVEATAAVVDMGSYCVVALNNTTTPSIQINGNISLNMGCGIISNSTSMSASSSAAAISANGNSHSVVAEPVAAVGTVPNLNGTTSEASFQLKQSDPYAGKYPTAIPPALEADCKTLNQHIGAANTTTTVGGEVYKVINPGCYKQIGNGNGSYAFSTSGDRIALNPGTYYINSADFAIGANSKIIVNSAVGTQGVTIILTGASPGVVNVSSNATVKLRAPSSGTYSKMLFIQSATATASSIISGNSSSTYDGAFYFPKTQVNYSGNAADTFKCAMIVGYIVQFSGTSNVQNNTTGCNAATKVTVDKVRLIG